MATFRTITWDEKKAKPNRANHRVSFTEAATVFDDPLAYTESDRKHSRNEQRYTTVGYSSRNRLLRLTHTEEEIVEYDVLELRIISARVPENRERKIYEEGLEDL